MSRLRSRILRLLDDLPPADCECRLRFVESAAADPPPDAPPCPACDEAEVVRVIDVILPPPADAD